MADHSLTQAAKVEPVAILDAVKAVVAVLVAAGWITLDDATLNAIITGAGSLLFVLLTVLTRRATTPLADPKTNDGTPLVPVADLLGRDQQA